MSLIGLDRRPPAFAAGMGEVIHGSTIAAGCAA